MILWLIEKSSYGFVTVVTYRDTTLPPLATHGVRHWSFGEMRPPSIPEILFGVLLGTTAILVGTQKYFYSICVINENHLS